MPSMVSSAAQDIADAIAQPPGAPSARWRWGTAVAVNSDGTMDVTIAGATLQGVRCMEAATGAAAGDRVRVAYIGTEAVVDGIRATDSEPHIDAQEWLAALGFEFGTYSGTVNITSSWHGMYYGTVTIPITARADTSYRVLTTLRCAGNLVWCSLNSKGTSSFEVFVISPRNSAQAVEIDWMVIG